MFWFLLGCVIYWLLVVCERSLAYITPHEVNLLRADAEESASARHALRLADGGTRAAVASLVLARIAVQILMIVCSVGTLVRYSIVHERLYEWSMAARLPPIVIWTVAIMLLSGAFALLFWGLYKADIRPVARLHSAWWLQRLERFVAFWGWVMHPFIPRQLRHKSTEAPNTQNIPDANTLSGMANAPEMTREKRDLELLRSILKFSDTMVRQVMQPRSKVIGLDTNMDYYEVLTSMKVAGFARYPVFDPEDSDMVVGILHAKDLVPHIEEAIDFDWRQMIHAPPMIVPETKYIDELLEQFKRQKRHMAIVVDEYGGVAGIVTMEDILEEVTGEIRDEFDQEQDEVAPYKKIDATTYLLAGEMHINDVCRITGLAPDTFDDIRADADTVAGLLLEITGDLPVNGQVVTWEDYTFEVTDADQRRITQVRMVLPAN
jgi:CBS domain containing-hemolysin-like protein